ncbi:MAG: tyrosine--tRNA ligase [Candidatus Latescibacteria bacterium 4484_7]|nr:MAG: tyrosine--tRNA ligase [Candidatus Latescibacteria bacterium 4484_7]
MNVYDVLKERGFVEQVSDEDKVRDILSEPTTCYIGFDPTADSFHVGSLVPIMALAHMQRRGHRVLAVLGGGTAMIGDPSGKSEMRKIISAETIDNNAKGLKRQLERFIDFSEGKALMLNNGDWLRPLNYIEFLRDIGRHFSVNRMIAAESYRQRLETGLNFIEFNYMLLQAYDYLYLYRNYQCRLQMGGNDQWGNILAGADLIRRVEGGDAEALTFPLLVTATGSKMGKTEKGAVWLDAEKTSPYEYYQFWINQDDRDVGKFLALFTFLPMDEVRRLSSLEGEKLREAKEVLAYEATKLCHGEEEAEKARAASKALFEGKRREDDSAIPTFQIEADILEKGIEAFALLVESGLSKTRGQARRLIDQGGAYVNGVRIGSFNQLITKNDCDENGSILLRAGKKKYVRVKPKGL